MGQQKALCVGLLAMALGACGQGPQDASLDGHYENSTAAKANLYANAQVIPPEWAPSQGVIVSDTLLTSYGREDLVEAILDAGVPTVWVAVSKGSSTSTSSFAFSALRSRLGSRIAQVKPVAQKDSGFLTVWARDWSPLAAVSNEGKVRLLDLNYYPSRPADDSMSRTLESVEGFERVSVPVYNEGGNFMNNSRRECLMTTRVTDANASKSVAGDMILDAEQVQSYYQDFGGCSKVHIFPRMPTEKTGHIDMWGKFLDDDTVIVGEIREKTLAYARTSSARNFALRIKEFTDARAAEIEAMGYTVIRTPMPLPVQGNYRSYTNSLLVNGTAIIPQYVGSQYADAAERKNYEAEVTQIYSDLGYKVDWIPSDELIATGGAVHCVTMQIPKGE